MAKCQDNNARPSTDTKKRGRETRPSADDSALRGEVGGARSAEGPRESFHRTPLALAPRSSVGIGLLHVAPAAAHTTLDARELSLEAERLGVLRAQELLKNLEGLL
eukprot:CAMPEP_0202066442 /NCGR_PEP_ID=MMETSP0963-20130614/53975_1 /ASSEMBLY_ACC=CAM_ASM_000494 /TAXON_ID=4773 /ORGANISM="Schizochytrium aggregatum, Strain ATCC28209" /LENGTH=105 /DNA_ID=CAMNT_0048633141 /DNA_START=147 /DNA_END=460 /DNA_ORIENTATION=-